MKAGTTALSTSGLRRLGAWHPVPLTAAQAREALQRLERRRQERMRRIGEDTPCFQLAILAARYQLDPGQDFEQEYRRLNDRFRLRHSRRAAALLELLYGQLLISHRLDGALVHLQRGFELASSLFAADDYFRVLERHRLLRQLPLATTPGEAEPLRALLTAARVIERMRQSSHRRPAYSHDPKDVYG